MQFRFLYLSPTSGETEVGSLDDLRVLIEQGTVGEMTPLFDVLTQQWAPARAHAVYRLLCDDARIPVKEQPGASSGEAPPAGGTGAEKALPDLGLTVTSQVPSAPDTDRAVRELLKERERDAEDELPRRSDLRTDPARWGPPGRAGSAAAASAPDQTTPRAKPSRPREPRSSPPTRMADSDRRPESASPPGTMLPIEHVRGWAAGAAEAIRRLAGHRHAPAALVTAGLLGLLVVLATAVRSGDPTASAARPPAALASPDVSGLVERLSLAEASGFRHMVAGMDSLRREYDVVEVPAAWLEGNYLADATRFPDVKDYWLRYQDFLDAVQASDRALFRAGLVKELRSQGVDGTVLSLRLSQSMREFEVTQPTRASMYLHMQELTAASLTLHDLLVEREPDISYEPALDARLSRDPVVEALPQDTLLRDRMWVLLERIFASLEYLGGDLGANRDNFTEMLLQGIEASRER